MNDHDLLSAIYELFQHYRLSFTVVYDTHEGWSVHPHSETSPMVDEVVSEHEIEPVREMSPALQDLFDGALHALRELLENENNY